MISPPIYTIEVFNKAGSRLGIIDLPLSLKISKELNRSSRLDFSIAGTDRNWNLDIINGRNNVKVYRDGILFWWGQIMLTSLDIKDGIMVNVTCLDWFGLLGLRFISKIYEGVDAGNIAWDMIDTTQGYGDGGLGIIKGTIESTTDRDRVYEFAEIGKEIETLTSIENGFDFNLTLDKVFNVYSFYGEDKSDTEKLISGFNIGKVNFKIDDYGIANVVKVVGDGDIVKTATDANSLTHYGRREKILKQTSWKDDNTLQAIANEEIVKTKWTFYDAQIDLLPHVNQTMFTSWNIGDIISVEIDCKAFVYEGKIRVRGYDLSLTGDGVENISIKTESYG